MKYSRSKDLLIAACALMADGEHAKAGAFLLKSSQEPDFKATVESMSAEQEAAKAATLTPKEKNMSALASIVEGMADGVNDIDDMLEDLDYEPEMDMEEPEDTEVDAPDTVDGVDVDTDDDMLEATPMTSSAVMQDAKSRLSRAQANLRKLTASSKTAAKPATKPAKK